jgi:hypothetical protein
MVFFSIGLPTRFAEWCDALILRLVEHHFGPAEAVAVNTLEQLASAVIRTKASNLVACCRQPVLRLQTEILQAERPFLVALGDPRAGLRNLVEGAGYPLADATRAVASSCAAMLTVTQAKHAVVLTPGSAADVRTVAAAIVQHLEIPIEKSELSLLVGRLPDTGLELEEADNRSWLDQLSDRERAVIDGALEPYLARFAGGNIERLVWEPELFYVREDRPSAPAMPASGPIDITGRARFLIFGPYINLPPGSWSATVVIGFSAETAGTSFVIEIAAGTQLAYARVQPVGEQVTETNLQFTIANSVEQPVEVRVVTERAAFDGRLVLGYVSLVLRAGVETETEQHLIQVLRQ